MSLLFYHLFIFFATFLTGTIYECNILCADENKNREEVLE